MTKLKMKTITKKSFILHTDSLDILEEMTNEDAGKLFKAIRNYNNEIPVNLPGLLSIIFVPFRNQFNRDNEKYNDICERNRKNGMAGGRPKLKPKKPTGFSRNPKNLDSDSDSDNDNNPLPPKGEISDKVEKVKEEEIPKEKIYTFEDFYNSILSEEQLIVKELGNYFMDKGHDFEYVHKIFKSFISYWTEPSSKGQPRYKDKKYKYFDCKRRLLTFFNR